MSNLQVSRDDGFADRARKYKVICNSECLGKISNGETMIFKVAPGDYEVYFKIDWCRSNKINLSVPAGGTVAVSGGSSLRGLKLLIAIVYVIFLPHKYLWVRSENS